MERGFVTTKSKTDLRAIVLKESLLWGDNATHEYFEPAARNMNDQWSNYIEPFLSRFPIDYTNTVELSCGHGRNSEILAERAKTLTLVDVNKENIEFCRKKFAGRNFSYIVNNGYDLEKVANNSATFFYSFDSAVHFDIEIIISYIKEFPRILAPGGYGFMHHSNDTRYPGADFQTHRQWRNFMSKEIFAHVCIRNGLEIVDQQMVDYGIPKEFDGTDCFSLFRKPANADTGNISERSRLATVFEKLMSIFPKSIR